MLRNSKFFSLGIAPFEKGAEHFQTRMISLGHVSNVLKRYTKIKDSDQPVYPCSLLYSLLYISRVERKTGISQMVVFPQT